MQSTIPTSPDPDRSAGIVPDQASLSVSEAAQALGVSRPTVYRYIANGKLPAVHQGHPLRIKAEQIHNFQRPASGRSKLHIPDRYATTIRVRLREDQGDLFEQKMQEISTNQEHLLSGTVARYIMRNQADPQEVSILLIWQSAILPPEEECRTALDALCADLTDMLDWEHAILKNGRTVI